MRERGRGDGGGCKERGGGTWLEVLPALTLWELLPLVLDFAPIAVLTVGPALESASRVFVRYAIGQMH